MHKTTGNNIPDPILLSSNIQKSPNAASNNSILPSTLNKNANVLQISKDQVNFMYNL